MSLPAIRWNETEPEAIGRLGAALKACLHSPAVARLLSGEPQDGAEIARTLPADTVDALIRLGIVELREGKLVPQFQAKTVGPHLVFSDVPRSMRRMRHSGDRDTYVDPMWDAPVIASLLVREPCQSGLDMGCGCGVIALAMSTYCRDVTALDVNPRALMLARFNVALNGVTNVAVAHSDLFAAVAGRRFDRIVFNAPVGVELKARNALESGERILVRFFSGLDRHVARNGIVQLNLCVKEWARAPFAAALRKWLAGSAFQSAFLELWRLDSGLRFTLRRLLAPFIAGREQGGLTAMRRGMLFLRQGGDGSHLEAATRYDRWARDLGADFGDAFARWMLGIGRMPAAPAGNALALAALSAVQAARSATKRGSHATEGAGWAEAKLGGAV